MCMNDCALALVLIFFTDECPELQRFIQVFMYLQHIIQSSYPRIFYLLKSMLESHLSCWYLFPKFLATAFTPKFRLYRLTVDRQINNAAVASDHR